jgi:hypothetical protein
MTALLDMLPFAVRDDRRFLDEMVALTRHHLAGCAEYRRIWPTWSGAMAVDELPFVHVGVFKHVLLRTAAATLRILRSSGTSGAATSRIALDEESSALQSRSSTAILSDFIGNESTPLLVVDHSSALRQRGEVSARIAAAMSLRPLASEIVFLLGRAGDPSSIHWEAVAEVLRRHTHVRVYGFTSILWQAWGSGVPPVLAERMRDVRIDFVHSGGWKKLEAERVTNEDFKVALLHEAGDGSRVIDYYGLVEQVGVVYPLCGAGFRHVPVWADVIVRNPYTLQPIHDDAGMLQLMNVLARGAPYQSVLTEDLGRIAEGPCPCGRDGRRFELLGRIPKAETRGCANV